MALLGGLIAHVEGSANTTGKREFVHGITAFGGGILMAAVAFALVPEGMKELNDATVEYCKTRKQFGVPIGKFQVLQHRMVDMFMAYEQSVSMTFEDSIK